MNPSHPLRAFGALTTLAVLAFLATCHPGGVAAQPTLVFPSRYASAGYTAAQLPGLPATTANGATGNPTNALVAIGNGGFSVWTSFTGSNAGDTGSVVYTFAPSYDGTNFATAGAGALTLTIAAQGTATVTGYTNFAAASVGHARYLQLLTIVNNAGHTITNNSVTVGQWNP